MTRIADSHDPDTSRQREPRSELIATLTLPHAPDDCLAHVNTIAAQIKPETRLVMHTDPSSMEADRFRSLRVYLRALGKSGELKTLMLTSSLPGEGKTVTSLNLATSLAERNGSKVILLEADLRNPSLCARLGLHPWPGLVHCLEGSADPVSCLRRIGQLGIYLLPAGKPAGNPIHMLHSDRFSKIMHRLRSLADWVIIDCPPVVPVPDVLAIKSNVDGCLWIVRANKTPRPVVEDSMRQVGKELILGILLNQAEEIRKHYSDYYHQPPTGMLRTGVR